MLNEQLPLWDTASETGYLYLFAECAYGLETALWCTGTVIGFSGDDYEYVNIPYDSAVR